MEARNRTARKRPAAKLPRVTKTGARPPTNRYREQYGVIVVCRDERHQEKLYDQLRKVGHTCKVVTT